MKTIKQTLKLSIIAAIAVFASSYLGTSYAKSMYYFAEVPGLIDNPDSFPFCDLDDCSYASSADIDLAIAEKLVKTDESTQVSNPYVLTISDGSSVTLSAESSDESIIASGDISMVAGNVIIGASSIKQQGTMTVTVTATVDDEIADKDYFNIEVSDYVCNTFSPLTNIVNDGTHYLIGRTSGGTDSSTLAKQQFLCLSNGQNSTTLTADYKLTADVSFSKYSNEDWDNDGDADGSVTEGWMPFGHARIGYSSSTAFKGTFNGQDHSITNLYINRGDTNNAYHDNIGLFGWAYNATIENINIVDPKVFGRENVGGLIGFADSYSIIKEASVIGSGSNTITGYRSVGGLIGHASSALMSGHTTVDNTMTDISVSCSYKGAGGLIARAGSILITNSYTLGDVHSDGMWAGGIFGTVSGIDMENCYSAGEITASELAGGLFGSLSSTYLVNGDPYAPGIRNCYSSANVTGGSKVGGLVGWGSFINLQNVFTNGTITGTGNVGGIAGYVGDNSSIITSYSDATIVGGSSAGGIVGYSSPYQWLKLYDVFYTGTASGTSSIGGLIGYGSKTSDIQRSYSDATITASSSVVGGLVGSGNSVNISKSYSSGNITSDFNYAGGLIGKSTITNITDSYSDATVTVDFNTELLAGLPPEVIAGITYGSYAGGLAGSIYSGTVSNSYYSGNVTALKDYASGIIGYTTSTNSSKTTVITDTYSVGSISAESNKGSLVAGVESDYVTITNTGAVCDPAVGVEEVCSSSQAQSINTTWSGTTWSGNGSSATPSIESSIMPTASWDSDAWNLGAGNPTLKNMPN